MGRLRFVVVAIIMLIAWAGNCSPEKMGEVYNITVASSALTTRSVYSIETPIEAKLILIKNAEGKVSTVTLELPPTTPHGFCRLSRSELPQEAAYVMGDAANQVLLVPPRYSEQGVVYNLTPLGKETTFAKDPKSPFSPPQPKPEFMMFEDPSMLPAAGLKAEVRAKYTFSLVVVDILIGSGVIPDDGKLKLRWPHEPQYPSSGFPSISPETFAAGIKPTLEVTLTDPLTGFSEKRDRAMFGSTLKRKKKENVFYTFLPAVGNKKDWDYFSGVVVDETSRPVEAVILGLWALTVQDLTGGTDFDPPKFYTAANGKFLFGVTPLLEEGQTLHSVLLWVSPKKNRDLQKKFALKPQKFERLLLDFTEDQTTAPVPNQ